MAEGWIKIHRKFLEWEWYDDEKAVKLFIHILFKANYDDKKWQGIDVKRGQFVTSLGNLSAESKLSIRSIRTLLDKLKMTGEIDVKPTSHFTIVTVCKYDTYQSLDIITDKQTTNDRQTTDKQTTTTKELKNKRIKEIKNIYMPEFELIWEQYDRKGSKPKAYTEWLKLPQEIKDALPERIRLYLLSKPERQYRKDLERYFTNETYESQESLELINGNNDDASEYTEAEIAKAARLKRKYNY